MSSPPAALGEIAAGRTAPLKSFLLDQKGVAGVGNIYADEALYRARLHPLSPAGSMKPEHLEALRDAVVAALEAGIDAGGSSIDDYRDGRGEKGTDAGAVPRPHPRGRAVPAPAAARSPASSSPGARPTSARAARFGCGAGPGAERDGSPQNAPNRPSGPSVTFDLVPGTTVKTEAVVLRSIRYGEADRILHLYSKSRGRLGAIAKGARKPRSRFGGRLEPFFRLDLLLHEGRGELLTVTNVATVDGYPRLRSSGPALGAAARACDAVLRLLDSAEPNPPAYNLLCRYLALLDDPAEPEADRLEAALSFRLKLALVAGFAPELASCARCGEAEHLVGFSGAAGGVVCAGCEAGSFELSEEAHTFMVGGAGAPAERGAAGRPAGAAPGRARGGGDARAPRARPAPGGRVASPANCAFRPRRAASTSPYDRSMPATATFEDRIRAWEEEFLGEQATRSYPARRRGPGARQPAAHALPARPRPDRPLQVLPPPQAQDPGLRRARRRSLPDAAHAHPGGLRDRPHRGPGARPQRGPDRGDRARPRPRPPARSATPARRRSTPPCASAAAPASVTTSTRCAWSTCSSATARGLNLTEQVRDGILNHTGAGLPATHEGRIVKLVDRVAYINHDIDDALRAGILRLEDLPAAEIELLGPTGSARIDTLVRDIVERSAAAGEIAQSEEIGGAMLRLRKFMFDRVYLGPDGRPRAREGDADHARPLRPLPGAPRGGARVGPRARASASASPTTSPG